MLPRQLHRRYMVFSGRVHRPKTGPFHSKAGIHVTKKCCNGADNLFKKFRMCPCRGYDHLFLEKSASRLALFQSRDPYLGYLPCPSLVLQVSFNNDAHGHDEQWQWAQVVQLWIIAYYTILPTIWFMSELTLKNSEVNLISEITRESTCAILPSKTLPNQFACTMEHHHKMGSRRVSCCLLSSTSFLV